MIANLLFFGVFFCIFFLSIKNTTFNFLIFLTLFHEVSFANRAFVVLVNILDFRDKLLFYIALISFNIYKKKINQRDIQNVNVIGIICK